MSATGAVPGQPLNQFSLDEYKTYLRIATTVNNNFDSANDLYVLDSGLNQTGSIINLGLDERIYSARFIGDRGYLVTFKQIDPFFVFDLSDPNNPKKTGELKIPGFSSYLHPLTTNSILGVGQENGQVKLSLFDVANPNLPIEIDKFSLNEYWTEVSNNHHAFLQDEKHSIFFLPGGNGGYIFSYTNNKLTLIKAISTPNAKRALYINDFLYVISDTEVLVFDQNTWNQVNKLGL
ncbi:MAG: Beta propeller domain protein [Parcubacteria group bacterium GW2011_GWA1_38_7]|nr:MAG: Beta propeller domain protein [Parcubacteria group bacterium GW2011_GWA1_38_7]